MHCVWMLPMELVTGGLQMTLFVQASSSTNLWQHGRTQAVWVISSKSVIFWLFSSASPASPVLVLQGGRRLFPQGPDTAGSEAGSGAGSWWRPFLAAMLSFLLPTMCRLGWQARPLPGIITQYCVCKSVSFRNRPNTSIVASYIPRLWCHSGYEIDTYAN